MSHSDSRPAGPRIIPPQKPDHSMKEEPETGWDTAPNDIPDPKAKRHPRTGGKGATPDVGEKPADS